MGGPRLERGRSGAQLGAEVFTRQASGRTRSAPRPGGESKVTPTGWGLSQPGPRGAVQGREER